MATIEKKQAGGKIQKKGPAILPCAVVNDILSNRFITGARVVMSKKHGISEARVNSLYKEYFGGATIAHAKTGLKKPIPADGAGLPGEKREAKTPRGKYVAAEPKTREDSRAKPRVIKKPIQTSANTAELDLDKLGDLPASALNQQANIIAGQIHAGNNNEDLIAAIHELIKNNELLSRATYSNLLAAQSEISATADKKAEKDLMLSDNIAESEEQIKPTDDSTKFETPTAESDYPTDIDEASESASDDDTTGGRSHSRHTEERPQLLSRGISRSNIGFPARPGVPSIVRQPAGRLQRVQPDMELNSRDRVRPTGNRPRAQPVSKISQRPEESEGSEESANSGEDSEYEQEVHKSKHRSANKGRIQPHNTRNNDQHSARAGQGGRVPGPSRNGSRANLQVPTGPLLLKRPL